MVLSEVSVLIPVYNYDITALVTNLLDLCRQTTARFEIICLDDASETRFKSTNRLVADLENVIYEELPKPISRAAIRNALAQRARFSYLLFVDNDSEIISNHFLNRYLSLANPTGVLIGGTVYQDQKPEAARRLHWQYGRHREQRAAAWRRKHPYRSLHLNNFLISRDLYARFPLPERIRTYGHEDSHWGKQLEQAGIEVTHIDNPVRHAGLEPADIFLHKTELAVQNLRELYFTEEVGTGTPLIRWYNLLTRYRVRNLFVFLFKAIKPLLLFNLKSDAPRLFFFDVYKLGLFTLAAGNNR